MKKYVFNFYLMQNGAIVSFPEFVKEKAVLNAIKKAFRKLFKKKVIFKNEKEFYALSGGKKKTGVVEYLDDNKVVVKIAENDIVIFDNFEIDDNIKLLMEDKNESGE